jgi:hypothetical protein
MPADDHAAEMNRLRRRYPHWTIWFGLFTGHWFALPPQDRDVGDFVEAATSENLIARIEVIECAVRGDEEPYDPYDSRQNRRRPPHLLHLEGAVPPRLRRVPMAAWPGITAG